MGEKKSSMREQVQATISGSKEIGAKLAQIYNEPITMQDVKQAGVDIKKGFAATKEAVVATKETVAFWAQHTPERVTMADVKQAGKDIKAFYDAGMKIREGVIEKTSNPFTAEIGAVLRGGRDDLWNSIIPAFPDSAKAGTQIGAPGSPTPQLVTEALKNRSVGADDQLTAEKGMDVHGKDPNEPEQGKEVEGKQIERGGIEM